MMLRMMPLGYTMSTWRSKDSNFSDMLIMVFNLMMSWDTSKYQTEGKPHNTFE